MQVRDVMVFGAVTVNGSDPMVAAAQLMQEQGVGMLVVGGESLVEGVLTDRDIATRCVAEGHDPNRCQVTTHASKPVLCIDAGDDVFQAVRMMRNKHIKRLPVTEGGSLVGVVSITDITQSMDQPLHDLLFGGGRARKADVAMYAGQVSHYFTKLGVAGIDLSVPLHRGDKVHFIGHTTDLQQSVESMQINHKPVEVAYAGDDVAIKVDKRVRVGDTVYIETGS